VTMAMSYMDEACWYLWYVGRFGSYAILCFRQDLCLCNMFLKYLTIDGVSHMHIACHNIFI
jgi:hypothetical protein